MTLGQSLFKMCFILFIFLWITSFGHAQIRRRACCVDNQIYYHNGAIMLGTVNIYYIWYGSWDGTGAHGTNNISDSPATQNLLQQLIPNLSGSPYGQVNTTYYDSVGTRVSGLLAMAGSVHDGANPDGTYSHGTTLSEIDVFNIVNSHIGNDLPLDPNGIYMVLTSSDVDATLNDHGSNYEFCHPSDSAITGMCGWHGSAQYFNFGGSDIKFGFVGNSDRCRTLCVPTPNQLSSPNSDIGGDAMVNHVTHEIEETINDPDGDAWYDASGYESADKCVGKYGTTFSVNGATANMVLNGTYYLIQQNWANAAGGYCASSY